MTRRYVLLLAARTDAEKALNPTLVADKVATTTTAPALARNDVPSPPVTVPPTPTPTPDPAAPRRAEFDRLIAAASSALASDRYSDARQNASRAKALGVDGKRADDAMNAIEVGDLTNQIKVQLTARAWTTATPLLDRLAAVDPNSPFVRTARQNVGHGLAEDNAARLERVALGAFYRGNYQQALATLGQVPGDVATPRVLFYMACSNAALALLNGEKGKAQLQSARDLFKKAQPGQNRFSIDRKYISPRIMRALEGTLG